MLQKWEINTKKVIHMTSMVYHSKKYLGLNLIFMYLNCKYNFYNEHYEQNEVKYKR